MEGGAGTASADARPSDTLNLAAPAHAPIFVAPDLIADAERRLASVSPEAARLRLALESEPLRIQHPGHSPQ
jgi:bifunctional DNase/RNase